MKTFVVKASCWYIFVNINEEQCCLSESSDHGNKGVCNRQYRIYECGDDFNNKRGRRVWI